MEVGATQGGEMDQGVVARARGITKAFGDVVALDRIDLDVLEGQVHGLVGPNGAGKSTLLGLLLGLAAADGGRLDILGTRIGRGMVAPDGVAGFVDGPGLYPSLTPRQNLAAVASLRGTDADRVEEALARVGLGDVADDRVRGFSLGMRQRLGLATAILTRPRLLVLDEPTNGLDPIGARYVHRVIAELSTAGTAVVLSSHRMGDLADLCSDVTVLDTGRIVFSGPSEKLAAETGELAYRLRTSAPATARRVVAQIPAVSLSADPEPYRRTDSDLLVVGGSVQGMDELVVALVEEGVSIRELGPVVPPLEAAFLALTHDDDATSALPPVAR